MVAALAAGELAEFAARVAARLGQLADGLAEPLRSPVKELAARPGKRIRPMLVRACAGFGTHDPGRLVRLGALVEMLHLASLLHDDMIDRAATRRGGPAVHTIVGPELAMLAGLACFAVAGTDAADLGDGVAQLVSRSAAGLSYGELLDVERAFDTSLALSDYLELVERKTGDLFRLSCELGAAEAGAGPDTAGALAAFGRDLGVAFQILDDCLDLAATGTGKPAGTDHLLGLFGAPTLHALSADPSGELARLLLSADFSVDDMPAVRAMVTQRGGLAAARTLARERYDHALSAVDGLADTRARDMLLAVAELAWQARP